MIALVSCQASSLLGIGNYANGRGQFPVTKQEMATKSAAREVLVLATEDDCSGRSNSDNREGIDGAIHAYRGKTSFSTGGLEDVRTVMGEAISGPGPCSFSTRRISWVYEDELLKEDHLSKQSFVPKAILHW